MTDQIPAYASTATSGSLRKSARLADIIRQMREQPSTVYNTATGTNLSIVGDALASYGQSRAEKKGEEGLKADRAKMSDLILGNAFPGDAAAAAYPDSFNYPSQDGPGNFTPGQFTPEQQKAGSLAAQVRGIADYTGDPLKALTYGQGVQRQGIEDERYKSERDYSRGRDTVADTQADRVFGAQTDQFGRSLEETTRHNKATEGLTADEIAAKKAAATGPDFSNENMLRNQYNGQAQNFVAVRDAFSRVKGVGDASDPAAQMALIFGYMKMLDPGSTVREGEYATAQNTTGLPGIVTNAYNRLIDGKFLTTEQIAGFKAQANEQYKRAEENYGRTYDFYQKQAQSYLMDPSIIQDFRLPKEAGAVATEAAVPPNTQHQPPGPMGTRAPGTGSAPFEWGKPSNPAPQHPMTANGEPDIDAILQKLPPGMRALLDQADAPAGAAAPAPASAAPPPEAIAMLRANPTPAEMQEFDVAFGAGAAQKVLNGAR